MDCWPSSQKQTCHVVPHPDILEFLLLCIEWPEQVAEVGTNWSAEKHLSTESSFLSLSSVMIELVG